MDWLSGCWGSYYLLTTEESKVSLLLLGNLYLKHSKEVQAFISILDLAEAGGARLFLPFPR